MKRTLVHILIWDLDLGVGNRFDVCSFALINKKVRNIYTITQTLIQMVHGGSTTNLKGAISCRTLDAREERAADPPGSFILPPEFSQRQLALSSPDRSANPNNGLLIISVQDEVSTMDNSAFINSSTSISSSSSSSDNMSLRASEVCSCSMPSITSSQDDMLIRANTSISDEEDGTGISQHSEGDLLNNESTSSACERRSKVNGDYDENLFEDLTEKDEFNRDLSTGGTPDFSPTTYENVGRSLDSQQHESRPNFRRAGTEDEHDALMRVREEWDSKSGNGIDQENEDNKHVYEHGDGGFDDYDGDHEFWFNDDWTEDELDSFIQASIVILPFLYSPPQIRRKIPMPPLPPKGRLPSTPELTKSGTASSSHPEIMSALPPEFICFLCNLPIIGATTLDCGCNKCACLSCIESQYVEEKCLLCHDPCRYTPCLPLDKAILRAVTKLSPSTIDKMLVKSFQARYYFRVLAWRKEVNRRHVKQEQEQEQEQLLRLNDYAQYEEEHFERCKDNKWRNACYHSVHFVLLNIVVPVVLVIGGRAFRRRG